LDAAKKERNRSQPPVLPSALVRGKLLSVTFEGLTWARLRRGRLPIDWIIREVHVGRIWEIKRKLLARVAQYTQSPEHRDSTAGLAGDGT